MMRNNPVTRSTRLWVNIGSLLIIIAIGGWQLYSYACRQLQSQRNEQLINAITQHNLDAVKRAIAQGAQLHGWIQYYPETKTHRRTDVLERALIYPSMSGQPDITRYLLDEITKDPVKPEELQMIIDAAVREERLDILGKYASRIPRQSLINSLQYTAITGKNKMFLFLLEQSAARNLSATEIDNLLLNLSLNSNPGAVDILRTLVMHGVSIRYSRGNGAQLLMNACMYNEPELVQFLLEQRVDLNFISVGGACTESLAARHGDPIILQTLLSHGANVRRRSPDGYTPLHGAIMSGFPPSLELMRKAGADVNAKGMDGATPLHIAAQNGIGWNCEWLLTNHAQIDALDKKGRTPLLLTLESEHLTTATLVLLAHGANWHLRDREGNTAFLLAVKSGNNDAAHLFVAKGADIKDRNHAGQTALMLACGQARGNRELAQFLLDHGADPNARDSHGTSVLQLTKKAKHLKIVPLLVQAGASE